MIKCGFHSATFLQFNVHSNYKIQLHFGEYEASLKTRPTREELKDQFTIALSLREDLQQRPVEQEAPVKSIYDYLDEFIKEQS